MLVDRRRAQQAIYQVTAPVLLLWGEQDPSIMRLMIDHLLVRWPHWDLHAFASAGHAASPEIPHDYVDVVGRWLQHTRATAEAPADVNP